MKQSAILLCGALLCVLSSACEPIGSPATERPEPQPQSQAVVLNLRTYQNNASGTGESTYDFHDFDRNTGSRPKAAKVPPGGVLYAGELETFDAIKTKVYVQTAPRNRIDRVMVAINGGTGTDPRHFLLNRGHRIMVMVSQRGLHEDDMKFECPLGAGLTACLNKPATRTLFRAFNPKDNGRDVVDVLRVIAGQGTLKVDGRTTPAAQFFAVADKKVDIETGSYGATILAYALEFYGALDDRSAVRRNAIGRVFIDGPSAPYEYVISDGFRNTRVALHNMLDSLGLTTAQKAAFLSAMRARHTAFVTDTAACSGAPSGRLSVDCPSSGMIWKYLSRTYQRIAETSDDAERRAAVTKLRRELIAIPARAATSRSELDAVSAIYASDVLNAMDRSRKTWESNRLVLTGGAPTPLNGTFYGFTSRIGQICSAYVLRAGGDSQSRFDAERSKAANDPYWYGFLIDYRELLSICSQASASFETGITPPPSSLAVSAEGIVQFGAGTDEKHHQEEMAQMAALFGDRVRRLQVYLPQATQGGGTPVQTQRNCADDLRTAAFSAALAQLAVPMSCS